MDALALALALALGPTDFEEDRLPRTLAESFVPPVAAPADEGHEVLMGLHFGVVDAVDGDRPGLVAGVEWRFHILPWLGASGTVDYQTRQVVDKHPDTEFFQIPFMWSILLYPPFDLGPLRFYGAIGGGFTITYVSGSANFKNTTLNFLAFLGLGVEIELSSTLRLDAEVRFVSAGDPLHTDDFGGDWSQATVGLLYKLPK